MADSKKKSFSSSADSQYFFMKISWIGPWVGRITRLFRNWIFCYFKINLPIDMGINRWDWKTGTYNVEFVAFHT